MKLKVEQVGNPDFGRYAIVAENQTWWDGEKWTAEKRKAMLYASLAVINQDFKRLEKEMQDSLIELTGRFVVRITGLKDITDEQLSALAFFMSEASSFTLDYSKKRPSGFEDANISSRLIWASLRRKKKSESD